MSRNTVYSNFSTMGDLPYANVLRSVQGGVAGSLTQQVETMKEEELKAIILRYIGEHGVTCSLTKDPNVLTDYIYHDMAEYSFISREKLFDRPGFEELNINAWNVVEIMENGRKRNTDYSFLSPEHALDIHRRIFRKTKTPFDETTPRATADIGSGVRITALRAPIVDADVAVASSIRKVNTSTRTPDEMVTSGSLVEIMMRFLLLCARHGISYCISGETGAGKTTLAGAILKVVSILLRTITIEQGSREWDFRCYDVTGKVTNSVVHMKTRKNETNPSLNIDQDALVQDSLRLDPEAIAPGEVRGKEAFEVMEAANTGHMVVTTVHSNGTEDTPERIVTLAKKAYDMDDKTLFGLCSKAFPILVHMEMLADRTRRVTEIREVTGCINGEIQSQLLFAYVVSDNIYEGDECVRTVGKFKRVAPISDRLAQTMLKRGARRSDIEPFLQPAEEGGEIIK